MIRKVWDFIFALITASSKYNRFLERSENNMKAKTKVNILGFFYSIILGNGFPFFKNCHFSFSY